jgi:hypothetical protein
VYAFRWAIANQLNDDCGCARLAAFSLRLGNYLQQHAQRHSDSCWYRRAMLTGPSASAPGSGGQSSGRHISIGPLIASEGSIM